MSIERLNFPVAVAQMRPVPGNIEANLTHMLRQIEEARAQGAKLIVFPELATSGYLLGDRWEQDAFIREISDVNDEICAASTGIVVVWGSVYADWYRIGEDGRVRKYNAALIAYNGEWVSNNILKGWVPKTNLPKYRFFDDARHFYPATKLVVEMRKRKRVQELWELLSPFVVTIDGVAVRLGLSVCEDLWEQEYNEKPSKIHGAHHVDLLINLSQSPWTAEKWHARDNMLMQRSGDAKTPILYVNTVGLQNNGKNLLWFDGNSAFINEQQEFLWRGVQHEENLYVIVPATLSKDTVRGHTKGVEEIYGAMVPALQEFFAPFKRVVIGLSGGIDSAVSAALLVEVFGPEKILAINMPTQYNSRTTQDLARQCAENLGIEYKVMPIQKLVDLKLSEYGAAGYQDPPMLVRENIQARTRGNTLVDIAACENGVVICNGNKTEVSLGYFTLYGDSVGAAAFLGDLWKRQVYELARFINAKAGREIIPQGIIDLVPSAELSPDQNVDEGKGDPIFYPYHDELLRMFVERRWDPTQVLQSMLKGELEGVLGCAPFTIARYFKTQEAFIEDLERAWKAYCFAEFKRVQLPPVFVASRRSYGFDRRETMAPGYFTREYYRLRTQYLQRKAA